jgi:dihydrodipicolinate synthase/N-acetylneuraminate lyase
MKMKPKDFKGIIPPIMTAFTKEGQIYEQGTREIVDFLLPHVQGLYPCGTYGCGPLMSISERKKVAEIIIDQVNERVPVIVHVGTADTVTTVDLARHAEAHGAKAVGAICPYYVHHDDQAVYTHFKILIDAVNCPVFLYDNPSAAGYKASDAVLLRLAQEGLAGVKDSTFDIVNYYLMQLTLKDFPELNLISGTEAMLVAAFDAGAQAAVTGLANIYPDLMNRFYQEYLSGDREKIMATQKKVLLARKIMKFGPTVPSCHAILKMRGIDSGYPRLPFTPVSAEVEDRIRKGLINLGLL